jgi:outer membrane protein TolC
MHIYLDNSQPSKPSTTARARIGTLAVLMTCALMSSGGCAKYADEPEINPRIWAPQAVEREWVPSHGSPARVVSAADYATLSDQPPKGQSLGLTELIGFALANNPSTRSSWKTAQAAAAEWGRARAPFYPSLSAESQNGYQRLVDLVPKHWVVLKTWQSRNIISLEYDLIDFGRRDAVASVALNELVAANLLFNRKVQEVVFNVERSFYALDATHAGVGAADAIVKLATTDRAAADLRHKHGLATGPEVLLAVQREAQAEYDLENARLAVSLAQADLGVALGVRADDTPSIELLKDQPLPSSLGDDVEQLIDAAVRERPDLSAKVAAVRARQADADLARAALYPTLSVTSFYGEQAFRYRLSNPPTPTFTAMAPEYGATVTLKWDIFTGFSRVNSIRETEDARDAARADLKSAELDVAADVWRAYFTYRTAVRKYAYAEALLTASQSSYNSNLKSYRQGLATIVDLLSAERELAVARFTIIQSKAELLISAAAVSFATGAIPAEASP